jgi:hypothetical protein
MNPGGELSYAALDRLVLKPYIPPSEEEEAWKRFDGLVSIARPHLLDGADEDLRDVYLEILAPLRARLKTENDVAERLRLTAEILKIRNRLRILGKIDGGVVLQNRDRSTAASVAQVARIAARPSAQLLGYSPTTGDGAPLVFSDYDEYEIPAGRIGGSFPVVFVSDDSTIDVTYVLVESKDVMTSHDANGTPVEGYGEIEAPPGKLRAVAGNARAAAIRLAYDKGTAGIYVSALPRYLQMVGIDPEAADGMKAPMLVRLMRHEDLTVDIGDKTNVTGMAGLSAVEQAKTDMERVDLSALDFDEDGMPTLESQIRFVRAMPAQEAALLAPDGEPTIQARDRLLASIFAKAYGDTELVRLYAQAIDPEIRNVLGALAKSAPAISGLAGLGEYDIRRYVVEAASMAANAKRRGKPLSILAEQRDITFDDLSNDIAAMFARNSRSVRKMGDILQRLANAARSQGKQADEDMFGAVPKIPMRELAEGILNPPPDEAAGGLF